MATERGDHAYQQIRSRTNAGVCGVAATGNWRAGSAIKREPVLAMRDVIDAALVQPATRCPNLDFVWLVSITYFGMLDCGMDAQESRQWRDRATALARDRILAIIPQTEGNNLAAYDLVGQDIVTVLMHVTLVSRHGIRASAQP